MSGPDARTELELRTLTDEGSREFVESAWRRYHADYDGAFWPTQHAVIEPDRFFGFWSDGIWVATCGAFTRILTVPGGTVPAAAVAFVSVAPSHRRQGLLTRMMHQQLEDVHRRGEPVAVLWSSEAPIYGRFGYGSAAPRLDLSGPTHATAFLPGTRLADGWVEDATLAAAEAAIPTVHASVLPERPGGLNRTPAHWALRFLDVPEARYGASALRFALHHVVDGSVDGYAIYRVKSSENSAEIQLAELEAADPAVRATLWRYLLDIDLTRRFSAFASPDGALRHLVADTRLIEARVIDSVYLRLVDVEAALTARGYAAKLDVVVGVIDAVLHHNHRGFRMTGGPSGMVVTATNDEPDLRLNVRELGASYLGGVSLRDLHLAGLIEERTPGSVSDLANAFAGPRDPFCPDAF